MSLEQIKNEFSNGKINKAEYIEKMYGIHSNLFDYAEFIKGTDIDKIEILNGKVILTTKADQVKMIAKYPDKRIIPIEILNFSDYEVEILNFLKKLIKPDSVFFDIGGNIGWYTINLFKANKNLQIYTFEPIPATYEILKENCTMNGIPVNRLYNFGFSNDDKDTTFYFSPELSGNSSLVNLSEKKEVLEVKARIRRMDKFTKENNVKVDYIKIDVEGAELMVFQGALETLKRDKTVIFTEMLRKWSQKFNYHPNEIISLLKSIGYSCFIVKNEKLIEFKVMDESTTETNFFFLHDESHLKEHANFLQANS